MQIKTINRYHFTLIRMEVIKKTREQMLERMLRKGNPCTLLVGMYHDGRRYGDFSKSEK